jgi:hypothetical protein
VNGVYINRARGWEIDFPPGWEIDSSDIDSVSLWNVPMVTTIVVGVESVGVSKLDYVTTQDYVEDWTYDAPGSWASFYMMSDEPAVIWHVALNRYVNAHEFQYFFRFDGEEWRGFTLWYVNTGTLWEFHMVAPDRYWSDAAYEQTRLKLEDVYESFRLGPLP